jgi:hypothetical protein
LNTKQSALRSNVAYDCADIILKAGDWILEILGNEIDIPPISELTEPLPRTPEYDAAMNHLFGIGRGQGSRRDRLPFVLDEHQFKYIVENIRKGKAQKQIARDLDVRQPRVSAACRCLRVSRDAARDCREAHAKGVNMKMCAMKHGISYDVTDMIINSGDWIVDLLDDFDMAEVQARAAKKRKAAAALVQERRNARRLSRDKAAESLSAKPEEKKVTRISNLAQRRRTKKFLEQKAIDFEDSVAAWHSEINTQLRHTISKLEQLQSRRHFANSRKINSRARALRMRSKEIGLTT